MLRIQGDREHRKQAMLQIAKGLEDDEQVCWALLVYGIYMATNSRRQHASAQGYGSLEVGISSVKKHIRNAVAGHARSEKVLRCRFC